METSTIKIKEIILPLIITILLFTMMLFSLWIEMPRFILFGALFVILLLTVMNFCMTRSSSQCKRGEVSKLLKQNSQFQEYITASWDSNKKMIHEEKTLAIKYMMMGISHEISTPMGNTYTAISVLENLLKSNDQYKENEKINAALSLSMDSIRRSIALINKFKETAQVTNSEMKKSFNLKELLNAIYEIKNLEWTEDSVQQFTDCPDDLILNSFPYSLNLIIEALINNAQESMSEGKGEINISCNQKGSNISISIVDNGSGIQPEIMENISDPFFTTGRGGKHMGLGLSMAQNLCLNLFKGDLTIESELGLGTTITIFLPDIVDVAKVLL